eukprot:TRINITY_DN553_c0_g3_i1.p1 TRINITY_DN553_c0_g3~~TRINITY_DN553_c0_g3_i1.p1  ORF type:complete len:307 (+),score=118.01 TRINITY_DN553_c0_g3_i1:61-981(+)
MVLGCCASPPPRSIRQRSLASGLKRAGSWVLEEPLGKGLSEVRAARHCETGSEAAVKIQRRDGGANCAQFAAETAVLTHLKKCGCATEHIVMLLEAMRGAKGTYVVLEKVAGQDLASHMAHGAFHEGEARWIFEGVAAAMVQLQRVGVAHRDIKLDNIMVDVAQRRVKLVDFGLARIHDGDDALSYDVVGTEMYLAPEVIRGPYDAFQADVFSLGVALCVAVTGLFPRLQASATCDGLGCTFPAEFDALSEPLQHLIKGLTAFRPEDRIPLEAVPAHPWFMGTASPATTSLSTATSGSGLASFYCD